MCQSYADYYDQQAEATAWHGPAVVFGLMYPYVRKGQSLLDIGIGTGLGSVPFAQAGLRIYGMDNSDAMLDGARSKGLAYDLRDHDMMSMPYPYDPAAFDHAICVGVLQFFPNIGGVLRELGRVLRVSGVLGFTVADWRQGQPLSFSVDDQHIVQDRDLVMYRHPRPDVQASLELGGFTIRADIEFVAYMDADRSAPMSTRAYVAQRDPSN